MAKTPKTIIAIYGDKVVNMDYLIPRGIMGNVGRGHVVEDGKVYALSGASRMAKVVTDPAERAAVLACVPTLPPGTK